MDKDTTNTKPAVAAYLHHATVAPNATKTAAVAEGTCKAVETSAVTTYLAEHNHGVFEG